MKILFIFPMAFGILACAATPMAPSTPVQNEKTDSTWMAQTQIVTPKEVTPPFAESAAATKSRGDASFIADKYVYRGATAGLIINEIKENTLFEHSTLYLPGAVSDIVIKDNTAFVACGPAGVFVVDVKDPANPQTIKLIDTPGGAFRLAQQDNLLVIADGTAGVIVVDISQPHQPEPRAAWQSDAYVRCVAIKGQLIYVAEGRAGVSVLELVEGPTLKLVTRHNTDGQARAVALDGSDRLLVADGPSGLLLLDIATPAQIKHLGSFKLVDMARDVVSMNNRAYVASGDDGIIVIDVKDAAKMSMTTAFESKMPINRVRLNGQRLLAGNDSAGLAIIDISSPDEPNQVFPEPTPNKD
jgi:hypothetical protein